MDISPLFPNGFIVCSQEVTPETVSIGLLATSTVCYGIALTASQFAENERRIGYFRTELFYTDTILVGAGLTFDELGWASDSRLRRVVEGYCRHEWLVRWKRLLLKKKENLSV